MNQKEPLDAWQAYSTARLRSAVRKAWALHWTVVALATLPGTFVLAHFVSQATPYPGLLVAAAPFCLLVVVAVRYWRQASTEEKQILFTESHRKESDRPTMATDHDDNLTAILRRIDQATVRLERGKATRCPELRPLLKRGLALTRQEVNWLRRAASAVSQAIPEREAFEVKLAGVRDPELHSAIRELLVHIEAAEAQVLRLDREQQSRLGRLDSYLLALLYQETLAPDLTPKDLFPLKSCLASLERTDGTPDSTADNEREAAASFHRSLMPQCPPKVAGLGLAHHYTPSRIVGGDLFDYYPTNDGLLIFVGDVNGHGINAAMIGAMAKSALTAAVANGQSVDLLASGLNRTLYQTLQRRRTMTMAIASVEPNAGRLTLVSAGHPPVIVRHGDQVDEISSTSDALASHAVLDARPVETTFAPGDLLLFVTDGVVSATDPSGSPFGLSRLKSFLSRDQPPGQLPEALAEELKRHTGRDSPEDDSTIIAVWRP